MKEAVALTGFALMRFAVDTFKTCLQLTGQAEMPRRQVGVRGRREVVTRGRDLRVTLEHLQSPQSK